VKFAIPKTLYNLTNSYSRNILDKLCVTEAFREFVAFYTYVTLKFITIFTTATSPFPEQE
jgi:hypothetical protein